MTWVDCSRADDDTVLRWIYTQFKRAGITADTECCERIMRYCLSDMSRISGETEKLIAFASDTKKVTAQDVDAVVYKDAEYKTYEMSNALGIKNYGKFMAVQNELLAKGMDETAVLNALCSYYRGIDVYKRQVHGSAQADACAGGRRVHGLQCRQFQQCLRKIGFGRICCAHSGRIEAVFAESVSYTHLDVYKRQVETR